MQMETTTVRNQNQQADSLNQFKTILNNSPNIVIILLIIKNGQNFSELMQDPMSRESFFVNLRLMNYSRFFGANWSNSVR